MSTLKAQFPDKLHFLFTPHRYKVAYGGRGSGKSWAFARALLIQGFGEKHRVLCAREIQKSVKDSVHKLLSDQIEVLGLSEFYEVLETVIRGKNGTEFIFSGLSSQTASSIKSLEGCSRVWVEEAANVSKKSWDLLVPTIRSEGSEIWVTFNPELESDITFQKFVAHPAENCASAHMNYHDNPWFPEVLEQERVHCQATESVEDYNNIWLGQPRSAVSGAIYANEVAQATMAGRICNLPYDPGLKVHTVWDMGFGDNMVVIFVQRLRSEIRVIDYIQVRQHRTDQVGAMVNGRMYNWAHDYLPHDGFHTVRGTGLSDKDILTKMGRKVRQTPNIPREDGIRNARNIFGRVYFDRTKCADLLECLKRYRRAETKHGGDGNPVHDEYSDGADAFRYMALNIDKMTNEDDSMPMPEWQSFTPLSNGMGY
jgi:phage terminase large subunit